MIPEWMTPSPLRSPGNALPQELRDFLHLPGPQTLLIRGPPGSGKSTLSLGLAASFPGARLFISSRVSRPKLLLQYPWIGALLTALLVGRLAWRFLVAMPQLASEPGVHAGPAIGSSPLTMAMFGLLVGYYMAYFSGLLVHHRRFERAQAALAGGA